MKTRSFFFSSKQHITKYKYLATITQFGPGLNHRGEVKIKRTENQRSKMTYILTMAQTSRNIRAEYLLLEWLSALQFVAFTIGYARVEEF